MIEHGRFDRAVAFGDGEPGDKIAKGRRRHAATPETGKGGQSGVVPARDVFLLDELRQKTF